VNRGKSKHSAQRGAPFNQVKPGDAPRICASRIVLLELAGNEVVDRPEPYKAVVSCRGMDGHAALY
jgi:hypothetical protein